MKYTLGIDLGTSGVKILLLSSDGNIIDSSTQKYTPDFLENGYVEQDPEVWYISTLAAFNEIIHRYPNIKIESLAISGQMHGAVFLDQNNKVIRPAILWNDTRTSNEVKEIIEIIGEEELINITSNTALEGFTLPKILWLKNNEQENYERLSKVILPKDYLNFRLTGNLTQEITDAAGMLVIDVKKGEYSPFITERLGLKNDLFPRLVKSTDSVGVLQDIIKDVLNINYNLEVIAGGADNSCATIGNGVLNKGDGIISLGTSGTVVSYLDEVNDNLDGSVHIFNYSYPDSYYAMGVMLCAAESLNYIRRLFYEENTIDEMINWAEKANVGSNNLVYLPYVFGERCPYPNPNAKGVFFGLSPTTTKNEIVRSILEGVAFGMLDLYDCVSKIGAECNNLYITGGGAKSELWCQILSDVFDKELKIINVDEGPALGAAMIAGVGSKLYSFEDIKGKTIEISKVITPNENNVLKYKKLRKVYINLYKVNYENFEMLAVNNL